MNILHYIPTYAPAWKFGGPVRSVSALCEELVRQGHNLTVLTSNVGLDRNDYPGDGHKIMRNGVAVHYYEGTLSWDVISPGLEKAIAERIVACDILHVTAIWQRTARAAHLAAARYKKPVVVSPRGALGPYAWKRNRLAKVAFHHLFERRYLRKVAGFHYTSRQEAAESDAYRFGRSYCILPNGIDESVWRQDERAGKTWRNRMNIPREVKLFLYVGRLHHKKGLEILPEVLARVMRLRGDSTSCLTLIGPDEDGTLARVRESARQAGYTGQLQWVPTVQETELCAAYSAADVFLLPSLHENFGNAAVEALACGCPVLVSAETACVEYGHGLGMVAIKERSAEAWVAAILTELGHTPRRLGSAQRDALLRRVGLSATAKAMVSFYESRLREN